MYLVWIKERIEKMKEYKRPDLTDDEILQQIFIGAREIFCGGIYIATCNHKCGWDFLSFEDLDTWEDLKNLKIGYNGYELNDGHYNKPHEDGRFLIDVLDKNGWKFEFERGSIEW
jgi:hypothetical protein